MATKRKADCTPEEWAAITEKLRERRALFKVRHPTYSRDWKRKKRAADPSFNDRINAARRTPEVRLRELWFQARYRAKKRGFAFTIEMSDLLPAPTHCCVFPWVALNYAEGDKNDRDRASIDRVDNSKGYVKGNVRVISRRANTIKSDATPEELKRILAYIEGRVE